MEEFLRYRHSFNSGDLITVLPGMKHLYEKTGKKAIIYQRLNLPADYGHNEGHPVRSENGMQVCMNKLMFMMLKPLVESQEYVEKLEVWEGQDFDFDFDLTRQNAQMPLPGGDIHKWPSLIYPQLECNLSKPWIRIGSQHKSYKIIINRTARYNNPYISYFFLKDFQGDIVFIGTKEESETFKTTWGLPDIWSVEYYNFLDLAADIQACKFFIGNQSMCFHVADALGVPRILEVCSSYPNTFPTGANGYSFITQGALEYHFSQLNKS